ncbi:MAG: hypothetical protein PHF37_02165 [Phycisphaerae bacterium]|nr:hypothetical protein [Phycisphaerae bacterium]
MNDSEILEELLGLLEENGIEVRRESLGGQGGGFCVIKGQKLFFADTNADSVDVAALCAGAIAQNVDTESIYLRPEVREFIENYAKETQ